MTRQANILVVDDIEVNRDMLSRLVDAQGHHPFTASGGVEALNTIEQHQIDMVLLDIMMPGMDGYEVLSQIKENPSWRHIPVIMISAVEEMDSVVHCIKMGADDYLIKPFNATLLKARIRSSLERKYLRDREEDYRRQIEEYNQKLEEKVNEKTRELQEINVKLKELNRAKSDALRLIYYELNRPFKGVVGALKNLFSRGNSNSDVSKLIETVKQSTLFTQIDLSKQMLPFEMHAIQSILEMAVKRIAAFAQEREVAIGTVPRCDGDHKETETFLNSVNSIVSSADDMYIEPDAMVNDNITKTIQEDNLLEEDDLAGTHQGLCVQALSELLKIAVKFTKPNGTIYFSCDPGETELLLGIHATGRIINDEEELEHFFEVPKHNEKLSYHQESGLGAAAARHALTSLNGWVTVENRESIGISFKVGLRREQFVSNVAVQENLEQN